MDQNKLFMAIESHVIRTEDISKKMLVPVMKIASATDDVVYFLSRLLKRSIRPFELSSDLMGVVATDVVKGYNFVAKKAYTISRYTGIPWNYIWIWAWKLMRNSGVNLLFTRGVHYFTALQGGGKSSMMYHLMEHLRDVTGKGSYINADLEKERFDERDRYYYKYHKYFETREFWGVRKIKENDGERTEFIQRKRFNTDHYDNIFFDEWLVEMNHRSNKTTQYNEVFIAMIKSISRMRHQRVKRIYFASQLDTTDIQLMGFFKMIHEIEIDLDIDYWQWIDDGMFTDHIKGWWVWTYAYKRNKKKQATEKQLIKRWYYKKQYDMKHFETFSQAKEFYALPVDQIRTNKGVI